MCNGPTEHGAAGPRSCACVHLRMHTYLGNIVAVSTGCEAPRYVHGGGCSKGCHHGFRHLQACICKRSPHQSARTRSRMLSTSIQAAFLLPKWANDPTQGSNKNLTCGAYPKARSASVAGSAPLGSLICETCRRDARTWAAKPEEAHAKHAWPRHDSSGSTLAHRMSFGTTLR